MTSPFPRTRIEGINDLQTIIALTGSFNGLPAFHRDIPFRREGFTSTSVLNTVTSVSGAVIADFSPLGAGIELVSTSADDTAEGTRARVVRVWGIGPAPGYTELVTDVSMNGLTPVSVPGGFTYINKINVIATGTAFSTNAGTISLRNTATPSTIYAQIPLNAGNTSETAVFVVPKDCYGIYHGAEINAAHTSSSALFRVLLLATVDEFDPSTTLPVYNEIEDLMIPSGTTLTLRDMNILPPLSIITIQAFPLSNAANARVSGKFSLSLIKQSTGTGGSVTY